MICISWWLIILLIMVLIFFVNMLHSRVDNSYGTCIVKSAYRSPFLNVFLLKHTEWIYLLFMNQGIN